MRRPKTAVIVADGIAQSILENGLRPGAVLPTESRMIEQFGVSRGTLREALRLLENEGLIYVRPGPGGGPVVQEPPRDRLARLLSLLLCVSGVSLREVLEAREILEPALAASTALSASASDYDRLRDSIARLEAALPDSRSFLAVNAEFHTLIASMSGNRVLAAYWEAIRDISDGQQIWVRYRPEALTATLQAHKKICAAIFRQDQGAARQAMLAHMKAHSEYLASEYPQLLDSSVRSIGFA